MKSLRALALGLALNSVALAAAISFSASPARAEALILIDADSGKVLRSENATYPWYPASTSKLMTLYVTLSALRDHRITPDTLFTVSPNAAMQAPTKMGIPAGSQVTVDNAIKMMMVKSANDMAMLLAEGIDGSVDAFAQEMTDTAHKLGMSESSFVNPNGLPADGQIVSARDLAILARALIKEFPDSSYYWHIPAIKFGRRITRNYNPLLGRFAGADGMKTGFICASGFNLVATAQRNNKRLIAVVLGAPSGAARAMKAAELMESGFHQNPLSWLTPSLGTVDALTPMDAAPMNLKDEMCGGHRKKKHSEDEDIDADSDTGQSAGDLAQQHSILLSALRAPTDPVMLSDLGPVMPIVVYTGPTRTQDQIQTLQALPEEDAAAPKKKGKTKAAKSGESQSASAKATDDKSAPAKPATKPAATKPAAKKPATGKESQAEPTGTTTAPSGLASLWTALSSSRLAGSPPPDLRTGSSSDPK
jgi:D-alanyl-D-alanine carboxypeptidase